jgi:hypothetical protein
MPPRPRPKAKSNAPIIFGRTGSQRFLRRKKSRPSSKPLLEALRRHHNTKEIHREIKMTPQAAWNRAKKAGRFVLRPAPKCPWWPYVWSVRTFLKVGDDARVQIGSQRLRLEQEPGSKLVRCHHWNGDISILLSPPIQGKLPKVLLHCPA